MVGIIFPERNDSFDFLQAIEEYRKAYRIDKGLDKPDQKSVANKDFSLQEGEKMTLTIEGVTKHQGHEAKQKTGLKKLAAPKGFQPQSSGSSGLDLFGETKPQASGGIESLLDSKPQTQNVLDLFGQP